MAGCHYLVKAIFLTFDVYYLGGNISSWLFSLGIVLQRVKMSELSGSLFNLSKIYSYNVITLGCIFHKVLFSREKKEAI